MDRPVTDTMNDTETRRNLIETVIHARRHVRTIPIVIIGTGVARIFVWGAPGRRHPALHQSCTRLKLSRTAEDLWALQQSAESWVEPQSEIKIAKKYYRWIDICARVFVNVVSIRYIGMIYINVGELCFIPMNVHIELFNGVRQLRWRHLSPVVSTFSTSIRLLSSFSHSTASPFSLHLCPYVSLSLSLSVVPHPVFLICGLSLRFGDVDVFFLQSKVLCS